MGVKPDEQYQYEVGYMKLIDMSTNPEWAAMLHKAGKAEWYLVGFKAAPPDLVFTSHMWTAGDGFVEPTSGHCATLMRD